MEKTQTAVEWLCEKYHLKKDAEIVKQANKIFEKQIIDAHTRAYLIDEDCISIETANKVSNEYYNEIFKKD